MGQTASKVTKSIVSKTSRTFGKDPSIMSSSVVSSTSATTTTTTLNEAPIQRPTSQPPQQHQTPPPPKSSFISDDKVSSSSSSSLSYQYQSSYDHHDAVQRRILEKKAGSLEYKEMPQDLVDFLKKTGPVQQTNNNNSSRSEQQEQRKLRLPRHLRNQQDNDNSMNNENSQSSSISISREGGGGGSVGGPEQRPHIESMRLAENIPGYETSRSTNFSTKAVDNDNDDPTIYQAGQVLDIYDMIMMLRQRKKELASSTSTLQQEEEEIVQEIYYQQYAKKFTIPAMENEQERHLELLRKTLAYLEVPVIIKDVTDGSYDGVRPEKVSDFEFLGGIVMPPTSVKNVLHDFSDIRKKESE